MSWSPVFHGEGGEQAIGTLLHPWLKTVRQGHAREPENSQVAVQSFCRSLHFY